MISVGLHRAATSAGGLRGRPSVAFRGKSMARSMVPSGRHASDSRRVAPAIVKNDRIPSGVKLRALPFLWCSLALFLGGCPKRQAPTRIVYVPSPPPAATQASAAGAPPMVIEEPAPPEEPPAPSPQPTTNPEPAQRRRRVLRREAPAAAPENTPETTEPLTPQVPSQVPSLEPRESSAQEAALRRQIQGLQDDVRQRIAKLSRAGLSGADRKTLDDARTFFAQSTRALNDADLQRALNLARKASLLVSALEP